MNIIKKLFFYILLITLGSCGYEPIYSGKINIISSIQDFQIEGDKNLNRKIISSLNLKKQNKTGGYKLTINSSKEIAVAAKDAEGNISVYRTSVTVKVSLLNKNKIVKEKSFSSSFAYSNTENKFDLSQYQRNIEKNLIDEIIEEIYIFLTL